MPGIDRGNAYSVLSSDWTGLSDHLIAKFFPVRRVVEGISVRWEREPNSFEVWAPITDGNLEQTANWTSPFESQTADAKLSSLSSMFQIGGFESIINALQQFQPNNQMFLGALDWTQQQIKTLEGRTAVTKLNSTQVFSGMPPLRVNVTAHFRALFDAVQEVQAPMDQLMAWAVPKKLASQGVVGNSLDPSNTHGLLQTVYASEAPQIIGMQYADRLIKPLVIEQIPYQLTGPRDRNGRLIASALTMSLATLTAIDKDDWASFRWF